MSFDPVTILLGTTSVLGMALAAAVVLLWRARQAAAAQSAQSARDCEALNDRLWTLSDSEERYRSLVEAQGDVIVRRDAGRIVYANAAYAALLGTTPDALIGSTSEPVSLTRRPVQALDDGTRIFDECIAVAEGERWLSWIETVVAAGGRSVLQCVGRDITARIVTEEALVEARSRAEAASEAKSRFLATVSHEFRTPLNGILGMADLLGDTRLDAEQTTYVRALKTSGDALLSLVDDILDFAKVEAGKLELSEGPVDLAQLVETVSELMAPRAQAKGLEIATLIAPDLPALVLGDADRLRQILLNLVGNAVKFTDAGGVGIRLDKAGETLAITVADTGPGIAPGRLEAIFEEFEQGDPSSARSHGGTGLGLAIVRRLVMLMGGTVAAQSEPGQGAVLHVALPLRPVAETPPGARLPDWSRRRVLLVSAAPFGAAFLSEAIGQAGAAVTVVADSLSACDAMAGGTRYDAVLIDQALAGDEAATLAQAARKAGIGSCIVMLSPFERRRFGAPRAAGFTGFLVKPVRARSLYERLVPTEAPAAAAPPPVATAARSGFNVLVAEDNEINALLATRTLERLGCTAIWARDGVEAVEMAGAGLLGLARAFDLVLLDIRMPRLDGLSVARRIREMEAQAGAVRALPILAVTANVAEGDRKAALAAGMDGCLAKPLARDALRGWIDRIGAAQTVH